MESSDNAGDAGDAAPMSAQNVYSALGLSSEDVEALAQIPENEISVETLPYLIMQLKAKRAEKAAAATDTDCSDKPEAEPKQADEDTETSEKGKEKRESPPASSSSRQASGHDPEHHGKGEGHRRAERASTGGRKDSRTRKSSRERQSGEGVTPEENEFDDKPTVFPHICTLCKTESNGSKVKNQNTSEYVHFLLTVIIIQASVTLNSAFVDQRNGPVIYGKERLVELSGNVR